MTDALVIELSFEEAERRQRFWNDHDAELLARYPEEFVAVNDAGDVVAHDPDLEARDSQ